MTDIRRWFACGSPRQISLWDMSLERDEEEEAAMAEDGDREVPPQLLFVHQGQEEIREVPFNPPPPFGQQRVLLVLVVRCRWAPAIECAVPRTSLYSTS